MCFFYFVQQYHTIRLSHGFNQLATFIIALHIPRSTYQSGDTMFSCIHSCSSWSSNFHRWITFLPMLLPTRFFPRREYLEIGMSLLVFSLIIPFCSVGWHWYGFYRFHPDLLFCFFHQIEPLFPLFTCNILVIDARPLFSQSLQCSPSTFHHPTIALFPDISASLAMPAFNCALHFW